MMSGNGGVAASFLGIVQYFRERKPGEEPRRGV